jgi:membrane-associated phospholipid phosphatase
VLQSALASIDGSILEWLHRHATPAGMVICVAISHLGSPLAMTLLAFAGAFALAALGEWIVLSGWVAAFSGAALLDRWLKVAIHRPRPAYAAALLHHPTWSFPSGHAMGSLVGYGMLAYVMVLPAGGGPRRTKIWIVAGAALLIAAIGMSRLYLGVHYLSDVLGGYAAGMLWLSLCIVVVEMARRWQRRNLTLNPTS